jgi:Protein kinase domain
MRYRLDDRLAVSGSGEVWQATDVVLGRRVAVKLLRSVPARDAAKLARFRAGARHAGALSHENIARIYDYDEPPAADLPFMVMELVRGPSVAEELAAGPMDPARAMDIIAQAAAGLAAAHRAGLVHGDITPGSLLLAPGDVVEITNLVSRGQRAPRIASNQGGKRGAQPGPGDDLYALGRRGPRTDQHRAAARAGHPGFDGAGKQRVVDRAAGQRRGPPSAPPRARGPLAVAVQRSAAPGNGAGRAARRPTGSRPPDHADRRARFAQPAAAPARDRIGAPSRAARPRQASFTWPGQARTAREAQAGTAREDPARTAREG